MERVHREGEREVVRQMEFYNLDAIIAVGYRVNSYEAAQFRIPRGSPARLGDPHRGSNRLPRLTAARPAALLAIMRRRWLARGFVAVALLTTAALPSCAAGRLDAARVRIGLVTAVTAAAITLFVSWLLRGTSTGGRRFAASAALSLTALAGLAAGHTFLLGTPEEKAWLPVIVVALLVYAAPLVLALAWVRRDSAGRAKGARLPPPPRQ